MEAKSEFKETPIAPEQDKTPVGDEEKQQNLEKVPAPRPQ